MAFPKKPVSPYANWSVVNDYGAKTKKLSQFTYDRMAFSRRWGEERGCPSRPTLFKRLADSLAPGWFTYHGWTNRIIDAMCHERWLGLTGCSSAGKTHDIAGFATIWWLADPKNSSVQFCSTTMKMVRKRAWAEVQSIRDCLERSGDMFGNFVDSRTLWQYEQGDDKHAIFCHAVQEGDVNKTAANIQGVHTKRQMVVIDEAPAVPAAILKACANLYSVEEGGEFVLVLIGNAISRLDQFGRFIEPKDGWDSVSTEIDDWEGKPYLDGTPIKVIRFDFRRSPNITEGKSVCRHLPTKARVEARMNALAARGALNDPDHWAFDLGFPPPDGLLKTVFTNSLLEKYGAYGKHQFTGSNFTIIGALDPAFGGGDRPALRFGALGEIKPGILGLEWMDPIVLFLDATSPEPAQYQLVNLCRKHAQAVAYRGQILQCEPRNFAFDASGEGGTAAVALKEWSPEVISIEFGGGCSEDPISLEDLRLAKDVYLNKRAEMYFRTKTLTESGQLRGIDKDTAAELCTLEYRDRDPKDGRVIKIRLQGKDEYRKKFQKSPDLSDCGVELSEVARLRGLKVQAVGLTVAVSESFHKIVARAQCVYEDADTDYHSQTLAPVLDLDEEPDSLYADYSLD